MVGVGPFLTIPFMIAAMSGPHIIYAWIVGAFLSLCDGLVYAQLGAAPLRDIFLKRGKIAAPAPTAAAPAPPAWRKMELSPAEQSGLREILAGVADEELRRELESLLVKQLKLTKAKGTKVSLAESTENVFF